MNNAPIKAGQVSKTFGALPVLRAVNVKVEREECALITGRNGSGKSTLVRILAGLSSVSAGEALLFGQPARTLGPDERRRVGLLTHQSLLYPRLTARENLEFYARLYGVDHGPRRVSELLERIGLACVADERVSAFSRGMEQRLALARAVIASPDVLLMDEPFTALDAEGISIAGSFIGEALDRGCALVITAHEPLHMTRSMVSSYALLRGRLYPDAPGSQDGQHGQTAQRSAAAG